MSSNNDTFRSDLNFHRLSRQTVLAMGIFAATSFATAQSTIPDAQVEANVLKALAAAPELANESITTKTVYGTVTLSGSVSGEAARSKAENLAANAKGVQKVIDELLLASDVPANRAPEPTPAADNTAPLLLQSDGTYAPAAAQNPAPGTTPAGTATLNNPDTDPVRDQQTPPAPAPPNRAETAHPAYPPQPNGRRPVYPTYPGYTPYEYPPQASQQPYPQKSPIGGQVAGQPVTIPSGAMLRVRAIHTLSSSRSQIGSAFDGTVINDVVANGFVAIPRGAAVQGRVIDSKSSGALGGRGELSIQLTQVTLGGKVFPIATDVWSRNGADKTTETVNKTLGVGAIGAVIGAIAGGGRGAAIGGGVGVAAGLGSSAASGSGEVFLPAESIVSFHTVAEAQVVTVSEMEMQRLAYGAGSGAEQPPLRRNYRVYPGYYPPPRYSPYPPPGYPPY